VFEKGSQKMSAIIIEIGLTNSHSEQSRFNIANLDVHNTKSKHGRYCLTKFVLSTTAINNNRYESFVTGVYGGHEMA